MLCCCAMRVLLRKIAKLCACESLLLCFLALSVHFHLWLWPSCDCSWASSDAHGLLTCSYSFLLSLGILCVLNSVPDLIVVVNPCILASASAFELVHLVQIHDYAPLSCTVGLAVWFSDGLTCAFLVYCDPLVHQAFDVLLDTIIKPDALICDAIVQLFNYLFMC
jgi:hypothetical protein